MVHRGRGSCSSNHIKQWDPIFSTERNFREDVSYVQVLRDINADGDDLDIFLRQYESPGPSCEVEEVKGFSQNASLTSTQNSAAEIQADVGYVAKAWLDDREKASRSSRKYQTQLNALELYELLKQPVVYSCLFEPFLQTNDLQRFGLEGSPDADRRLM